MSRGSKETSAGILKSSMRDNYAEHGVDEYYRKVGSTYRNPHFPGIRNDLFLWLNKWWTIEHSRVENSGFTIFDMACGSGEVVISLMEWWKTGNAVYSQHSNTTMQPEGGNSGRVVATPRGKPNPFMPPPIGPEAASPRLLAADPFTAEAFHSRTRLLHCSNLSFRDVAEGVLPEHSLAPADTSNFTPKLDTSTFATGSVLEMTVCSFALHLIESPSELFSLLWELSTKCRWLVVLAPHKRPEIKDGWGWSKWNVGDWRECGMSESGGELLQDRVHCRVYRSLNVT